MELIAAATSLEPLDHAGLRRAARSRVAERSRGRATTRPLLLVDDGTSVLLDVDRWHGEVDDVESQLLATLTDPVIDFGCGPGRIGAALSAAGRTVLGIDPAPTAVAWALARGAPTLCRSVFDALPEEGRWASALLLDGNIGIGADPAALLARVHDLLSPGGELVAEVTAPGGKTGTMRVRVRDSCSTSRELWFPWARVSADAFPSLAAEARLVAGDIWHRRGRWFARATRP